MHLGNPDMKHPFLSSFTSISYYKASFSFFFFAHIKCSHHCLQVLLSQRKHTGESKIESSVAHDIPRSWRPSQIQISFSDVAHMNLNNLSLLAKCVSFCQGELQCLDSPGFLRLQSVWQQGSKMTPPDLLHTWMVSQMGRNKTVGSCKARQGFWCRGNVFTYFMLLCKLVNELFDYIIN